MSQKPFDSFLVDMLVGAADTFMPGSRYLYRCANVHHLGALVRSLRKAATHQYDTMYGFSLSAIPLATSHLIVAGQASDSSPGNGIYTDNFVAWLRDVVAEQQAMPNASLLVIHNSQLDTLLSSGDDISTTVWSSARVKTAMERLIRPTDPHRVASRFLLEQSFKEAESEGSGLFSFEALYAALSEGALDLQDLRLFKDSIFASSTDLRQLEQRYNENRRLCEKIGAAVEHSPNAIADRLADELRPSFVNEHIVSHPSDFWRHLELEELLKEKKASEKRTFELRAVKALFGADKLSYRPESVSGAGRTRVHMIVERDDSALTEIELEFSEQPEPSKPVLGDGHVGTAEVRLEGRRKVVITLDTNGVGFLSFRVRSKSRTYWDISVVVVPRGAFYTQDIVNRFLVRMPRGALPHVEIQGHETALVVNPHVDKRVTLDKVDEQGRVVDVSQVGSIEYSELLEMVGVLEVTLRSGVFSLPLNAAGVAERVRLVVPVLLDEKRLPHLFREEYAGELRVSASDPSKAMVYVGNREYSISGEECLLLRLEQEMVSQRVLIRDECSGVRHPSEIHGVFGDAYSRLLEYFVSKNTIPSLSGWPLSLRTIILPVVDAYREVGRSVQSGQRLTEAQRDIILAGTVVTAAGERLFSPLSPLVLAYYAELADQAARDQGAADNLFALPAITRSRLNPRGLLPYVRLGPSRFGYVSPLVDSDPMWLAVKDDAAASASYVPSLVAEKIEQFVSSFRGLFNGLPGAPIILNSVNNASNAEVFNGLARFAARNPGSPLRVHVNVIGDTSTVTEFERFCDMPNGADLRNSYSWAISRDGVAGIVAFLRKQVTFSRISPDDDRPYAHVTFLKAVSSSVPRSHDMHRQPPSAGAGGLINGETSRVDHDTYVSGVGITEEQERSSGLLGVAATVNRLFYPAVEPQESVSDVGAMALSVESSMRSDLQASYASSLWTTVIDPRVTLSFFGNEGDALLIHYSDQYTTSAAYDAITVTTRRDLYGLAGGRHTPAAIQELNAFNGEWLLRLITDNETSRKARLGVIAAYKLLWKVLPSGGNTVWIPLSMEEWVRVAGNIGLPKQAIDFSRPQGAGVLGDDVLFAGFGPRGVELIAVEVKTGQASPDFAKARAQASNLLTHMLELLNRSGLAGRVLRSLFVRQILLTCEKYELFDIFPENYFDPVVSNSEGWLGGDFDVVRSQSFPSRVVIAHVDSALGTNVASNGGVVEVVVPGGQFTHVVETPLRDLRAEGYGLSTEDMVRAWQVSGADAVLDDVGPDQVSDDQEGDALGMEAVDTPDERPVRSRAFAEASGAEVRLDANAGGERVGFKASGAEPVEGNFMASSEAPLIGDASAASSSANGGKASGGNPGSAPISVRFGFDLHTNRPVDWFPTDTNRVFNANAGIIGTMGTGKTEFTKSLVTQLVRNSASNVGGHPVDVLILDYKGDYIKQEFVEATNAKVHELFRLPLNPLALYGAMQMLPMHTASGFRTTLSKAFKLGVKQENRIKNLVLECYQQAGIDSGDRSSWARPAPTIADVWSRFLASDSRAEDSLYAALDSLNSFQIFEPESVKTKSLLDFVSGVTVVNLSGADTRIQNLVVAVILDLLYLQMHQRGPSVLDGHYRQLRNVVLVDEADNFMSQGFESLRKILKEGREFGVATVLSTQELTHFRGSDDDYAQYVLTWIVHRVGSIQPSDVRGIFGVEAKGDVEAIVRSIRELGKHQSLYRDSDKRARVIRDLAFWQLMRVPGAVDGAAS